MLNIIALQGNLTRDPEVIEAGETKIAKFAIAQNRVAKGEKIASFFECVAFGKTAELIQAHFKKGNLIVVNGRLQQNSWLDEQTNERRSRFEVVVENFGFCNNDNRTETPETTKQTKKF